MKRFFCFLFTVIICLCLVPISEILIKASANDATSLSAMKERAEAIINYKWTPSQDIYTWNGNTYNGRNYFKKGETVIGMPYTLFTTEVVSFSLLSLAQYKSKASSNYSASAYCVSTDSNRTGPVYGSCCADFVCEVFGGKFMNGSNMIYHNVRNIKNSSYGITTYNVKASDIKAGDAVSNTAGTHIVWIGEVTDTYFMIYEQTPPVAKKTKVYKSNAVNSNGYLVFGGSIYNIVTKSKEFSEEPGKPILSVSDKNTSDKAVTFTWNRTENTSQYDLRIYNYGDYNVGAPYGIWDLNVTTTSGYHKLPAGKYAAYITAISSSGVETPSEWITFDVVDPPGKSVLTATPGQMVTNGVVFNWTKAANAHTYDLRVYNYGDYNVGAPYYEFGMSSSITSTTIKLPVGKYSAYITTKASNGASEGGDSEWISFTVSEPAIDSNYPTNMKGYKMWIGETATQVFDAKTLNGYYLDDNEITIVEIYTNDWAKIKQIVDGTEKTAYIPLGGLISDKVQPYKMYLKSSADIYSRYKCETKQSSQSKDKEVTVIGYYKTDLAQICYTISNTNYIGWIEIDKLIDHDSNSHSYASQITTAATCTTDGVRIYTCSKCSHSYTEKINKTGHNWTAATCTAPKTCSTCGATDGSALGHSYTSKVTTAATCTTNGVRTYTCSKCAHSYTEKINKTGHNWTAATCTAPKTCSTCGATDGSALGHNYTSKVTTAATCTTDGLRTYTCSKCSHSYTEKIDKTGHSWTAATCTLKKTCSTCGITEGSALGHSYSSKITNVATCTTSGTKVYACSRCSDSYTETIPSTDHSYISTVVAPTCTEEGYTLKKCRNCDYSQKVDYTEAVGHNMGQWKTTREETCTEDGERSRKCLNCDYAQTQIIYASGHSMGSWKTTKQVTCTENGEKKNSCLNCDYYTTQTVYASGHSMSAWKTVKKATCTEKGTKQSNCSECDYIETKTINANGHGYVSEITKDATCTTTGVETFSCSVCEDTYTETIEKLGHKYSSSYTVDKKATCSAEGSKSKHCTRSGCTAKTSVTAIAKLVHTYNNPCDFDCNVCGVMRIINHTYTTTTTKATLSTNGSQVEKCKVCNSIKSKVTVYYPKTIKLSSTTLTYNGKTKTPSVTVKDSKGKTLKKDTDYTVTYPKKRKSIGKYTVTVTFKGNYSGTKKFTFEIVPAKVTLSKVTAGSKQLTATWKTVSGATGYEVVYSTSKKFTKKATKTVTIKSAKTKKTTIKKLKKGKKYYVKVRAYKTVSGKKIYGAYSSMKSVKVK